MCIQYDAQREYLEFEGDAYFERNFESQKSKKASIGVEFFYDFICKQIGGGRYFAQGKRLLEVGCSYGYNLAYLNDKCGFECYGVEPSGKAIAYGKKQFNNKIEFSHGTADNLKYEDEFFDVVIVGTCLYQVDRQLLARTLSEIDRVLIHGGFLVISDFDTPIPCRKENKHNHLTPTYKDNYGGMLVHSPYRYTLIEKRTYSFGGDLVFLDDIQERMSTQILYKERKELVYC